MGEELKPESAGNNQGRNPDGTFPKGVSGNPEGKPKGTLNFATKWRKFIDKVATQNEMTPDEIEQQLLAIGYKKAKEGDYQFYRDTFDRVYGKPLQPTDITTDGEKIESININIIDGVKSTSEQDISEELPEQGEDNS